MRRVPVVAALAGALVLSLAVPVGASERADAPVRAPATAAGVEGHRFGTGGDGSVAPMWRAIRQLMAVLVRLQERGELPFRQLGVPAGDHDAGSGEAPRRQEPAAPERGDARPQPPAPPTTAAPRPDPAPAPPAPDPVEAPSPPRAADASAAATEAFDLINVTRREQGLEALRWNDELGAKAQEWAEHLASVGRLSHSRLADGVSPGYRSLGENVGFGGSVGQVHQGYLGSDGHRRNILNPSFTHAGTGTATNGGRVYTVQVFMERR